MRYRLRRDVARAGASLGLVVVVLGLVGGAALASLVAARDTAASYTTFLARTNPSDLTLTVGTASAAPALRRLPGVEAVRTATYAMAAFPLSPKGLPLFPRPYQSGAVYPIGSIDGEFFTQDRVSAVAGRVASASDPDSFMATADAERLMGWHLGQVITMGFWAPVDLNNPKFDTSALPPRVVRHMRLVGTIVFNDQVVRDQIDRLPTSVLFTPASTHGLLAGPQYEQYSLRVRGGTPGVTRVERAIVSALPPGSTYNFRVTSVVAQKVARTVRPLALALGVFGALALVGAALTAGQLAARMVRRRREELAVLRALGARRAALVADALVTPALALALGAVAAILVSLGLSGESVIGPVRAVLPGRLHVEVLPVLGGAAVALVAAVAGVGVVAWRELPGRRGRERVAAGSWVARRAATAGAPASMVSGLHFAFEPGTASRSVPVRSVLVGVSLAVSLVVATLTFGSGLSTLVSHPSLYGWDWDRALISNANVPPQSVDVVARSPLVAGWARYSFGDVQIDGLTVPTLLVHAGADLAPPLLSGHDVRNVHQIVLGPATLALLHRRVGQSVVASYGSPHDRPVYVPPTRLTIVGSATLPAIGRTGELHVSMGDGAEIDEGIEPAAFVKFLRQPYATLNGPAMLAVRFRPDATASQRATLMAQAARAGDRAFRALPHGAGSGDGVYALAVQRPAEIINYRSMGSTPLVLALVFGAGVLVAFGLTVVASVRRRRRDLAVLKTLGFTRRQLGACIAWQATATSLVALVVGVPLGVIAGRSLWDAFARTIYAVPEATVPVGSLTLLVGAALALANVVAWGPSREAARTPAALALRAE